jgi:VanZ family protein
MLAPTMTAPLHDDPPARPRGVRAAARWSAFVVALVLNAVVLLTPDPDAPGGGVPGLDKAVHAGIFALLTGTGLAAGLAARWFVPVVLAWAALSEVIQAALLPARSGDWRDLVADAVGVGIGVGIASGLARRARRRTA